MGVLFDGAMRGAAALAFGVIVVVLSTVLAAGPVHAADLSVDRSDDPSLVTTPTADNCTSVANDCSLRGAITRSNLLASTQDIGFAIPDGPEPGFEVKTISPGSALPTITDTVTIDGYSQLGAVANSATTNANSAVLKIELSGANAGATASGLTLAEVDSGGTRIRGLVINRFAGDGVVISRDGPGGSFIEGNFIGTNPAGDAAGPGNGGSGVRVGSSGNVIGGPANAAQNVISANDDDGVLVVGDGSTGNVVSNNHIGTDADAGEDLGNFLNGVQV